jgi:catechol 2,3-dioxygenase-like lactoylglutathione lyase family enzyme
LRGADANVASVISGAHVILFSEDADADRAFFRDVLGLRSVDAGEGWLIFSLPPAELAVHPGRDSHHELYLMCGDLDAAIGQLRNKGVSVSDEVTQRPWGRMVAFRLPGGSSINLYEPHHSSPPTEVPAV